MKNITDICVEFRVPIDDYVIFHSYYIQFDACQFKLTSVGLDSGEHLWPGLDDYGKEIWSEEHQKFIDDFIDFIDYKMVKIEKISMISNLFIINVKDTVRDIKIHDILDDIDDE